MVRASSGRRRRPLLPRRRGGGRVNLRGGVVGRRGGRHPAPTRRGHSRLRSRRSGSPGGSNRDGSDVGRGGMAGLFGAGICVHQWAFGAAGLGAFGVASAATAAGWYRPDRYGLAGRSPRASRPRRPGGSSLPAGPGTSGPGFSTTAGSFPSRRRRAGGRWRRRPCYCPRRWWWGWWPPTGRWPPMRRPPGCAGPGGPGRRYRTVGRLRRRRLRAGPHRCRLVLGGGGAAGNGGLREGARSDLSSARARLWQVPQRVGDEWCALGRRLGVRSRRNSHTCGRATAGFDRAMDRSISTTGRSSAPTPSISGRCQGDWSAGGFRNITPRRSSGRFAVSPTGTLRGDPRHGGELSVR